MHVADHAQVVPPSHNPDYANTIISICRRFDIRFLCSCHDLDVLALALARDRLLQAGVITMLPDAEWARTCLDKFECGNRLRAAGFDVPWASISPEETKTALSQGQVRFPLLVKARLGYGSLGLHKCNSIEELDSLVRQAIVDLQDTPVDRFLPITPESSVLIQEFVPGPERCIDVVNDLEGCYAGHFICEVHAMRAGESDSATTIDRDVLGDMPHRLSALTQHIGIWGVDVLMNNGRPKIIDMNPRFTGDYPYQHLAGADIPAALIAWAEGLTPNPAWLRPAVGVSAYKDLVPTLSTRPCNWLVTPAYAGA